MYTVTEKKIMIFSVMGVYLDKTQAAVFALQHKENTRYAEDNCSLFTYKIIKSQLEYEIMYISTLSNVVTKDVSLN